MLENRFFKEHNHYIHLINDISSHLERNVYIMIKSIDQLKRLSYSKK